MYCTRLAAEVDLFDMSTPANPHFMPGKNFCAPFSLVHSLMMLSVSLCSSFTSNQKSGQEIPVGWTCLCRPLSRSPSRNPSTVSEGWYFLSSNTTTVLLSVLLLACVVPYTLTLAHYFWSCRVWHWRLRIWWTGPFATLWVTCERSIVGPQRLRGLMLHFFLSRICFKWLKLCSLCI